MDLGGLARVVWLLYPGNKATKLKKMEVLMIGVWILSIHSYPLVGSCN